MGPRGRIVAHCSFCGKTQDQVKRLVAGPGVFICDECVRLCNEVISEGPPLNPGSAGSRTWVKRTTRPRGWFGRLFRMTAMQLEG